MATDTPDAAPAAQKPAIVLIHGLWLTPLSWEGWKQRFESKGHTVLAPAWPGLEGTVEEVRQNTSRYERLGVKEITDHYDGIIRGLGAPPVIMGHSFGGLITQLLLDRGLGASAVAISPAQIKGVYILPLAQAKVASVALKNPANRHKTQMLTPEEFHYGFTNTLTLEESKPIYDRLAVPGPGRTLFQAAFANFTPHAVTMVSRHNSRRAPPTRSRRRRARSPSSRSTPTVPTTPSPRTAGKRWRTTRSTGPCATRGSNPPKMLQEILGHARLCHAHPLPALSHAD